MTKGQFQDFLPLSEFGDPNRGTSPITMIPDSYKMIKVRPGKLFRPSRMIADALVVDPITQDEKEFDALGGLNIISLAFGTRIFGLGGVSARIFSHLAVTVSLNDYIVEESEVICLGIKNVSLMTLRSIWHVVGFSSHD